MYHQLLKKWEKKIAIILVVYYVVEYFTWMMIFIYLNDHWTAFGSLTAHVNKIRISIYILEIKVMMKSETIMHSWFSSCEFFLCTSWKERDIKLLSSRSIFLTSSVIGMIFENDLSASPHRRCWSMKVLLNNSRSRGPVWKGFKYCIEANYLRFSSAVMYK